MDKEHFVKDKRAGIAIMVIGCSTKLAEAVAKLAIQLEYECAIVSMCKADKAFPFGELPPIDLEMITRSLECEPIIETPKLKHISREIKTKTGYIYENTNRKFRNYTGKRC